VERMTEDNESIFIHHNEQLKLYDNEDNRDEDDEDEDIF